MSAPLLVTQAEALGLAVDQGLIPREEAIASLTEWSRGGLTVCEAAAAVDHWQDVRAAYERSFVELLERLERGLGGAL